MPSCATAVSSAVSELTKITMRLGPVYEQELGLEANDNWSIPVFGRHYQIEQKQLAKIRSCSLGSAAAACAASPLMTQTGSVPNALADLLDIRVENGRCVAGRRVASTAPVEAFDSARAMIGIVQSKTPMTPPDAELLHATHAAHHATSDFECGVGPTPATSVRSAHMALEATARTEDQHHFLRMKDFSGVADPGWTSSQVCHGQAMLELAHDRALRLERQAAELDAKRLAAELDHELRRRDADAREHDHALEAAHQRRLAEIEQLLAQGRALRELVTIGLPQIAAALQHSIGTLHYTAIGGGSGGPLDAVPSALAQLLALARSFGLEIPSGR